MESGLAALEFLSGRTDPLLHLHKISRSHPMPFLGGVNGTQGRVPKIACNQIITVSLAQKRYDYNKLNAKGTLCSNSVVEDLLGNA